MPRSYEKLFEDGAKLKNSSSSVVCLLYNRYKCVIMLWLFGDPHVILFLFFFRCTTNWSVDLVAKNWTIGFGGGVWPLITLAI